MRTAHWTLAIFIVFAIFSAMPVFADDTPVQNATPNVAPVTDSDAGTRISEEFKNCVVDIDTEMTMENGQKAAWGGSGFFVDGEGIVQTVAHVVKVQNDELQSPFGPKVKITSYTYWVTLVARQKKWRAELVYANLFDDTARIHILNGDSADYSVARIGDSDKVKVGEPVYAFGSPLGLSNTLTGGHVSSVHRFIEFNYLEDFIQTDTPINPGNSGSPLINANGEVVGINDAGVRGSDGLAFSVSINLAMKNASRMGIVEMPWFGLEAQLSNFSRTGNYERPRFKDIEYLYGLTQMDDLEGLALLAKLTRDQWAIVYMVETSWREEQKSPAQKAGFKRGDLITKLNGKAIKSGMEVRIGLLDIPIGQRFEVEYTRTENGVEKHEKAMIVLEKMPKEIAEKPSMKRAYLMPDNSIWLEGLNGKMVKVSN